MRKLAILLVLAMVVLAGCGGAGDGGTTTAPTPADGAGDAPTDTPTSGGDGSSGDTTTDASTTDAASAVHPPDPSEDVLGWENGLWYNETIAVDRSDGLNGTELDLVVNRSMARVEYVRQLEFERSVPVEVISRDAFKANFSSRYNTTLVDRLHQNAKWEAMLMVGEDTDAIAVQQRNRGATIGGFYSPREERIVIVSENTTSPEMNEITLAQELFHALQDQQFNLSKFNQSTQEWHNAVDGIVEGDGNYVDYLYEQQCDGGWDCLMPRSTGGGGGSAADIHFGMYLVTFQPYSDGPKFVRQIHRSQGWEAVNAVYENPPQSTEQTIHPEKYGQDEPVIPRIDHSPSNGWHVLDMGEGSIDYAVFGEAGLSTMLFYPFYHSGRTSAPILGVNQFFNVTSGGQLSSFDPINYANEYTTGWDGDKLVPYVKGEPTNDSEMGYVWKIEWDSENDASEFREGYTKLLQYHGAEQVDGNTYRIAEGEEFADAFWVHQDGDTIVVVNAPTVDALDDVHADAGR